MSATSRPSTGASRRTPARRAQRSSGAPARRGPGRPPGHGNDAERRILDAALTAFAARGYAATGIRDIVAAAGVTPPTLYHHCRTKKDLFTRLLETACEPALRAWERLVGEMEAKDWRLLLQRFTRESFALTRADARIPQVLFQATYGPPVRELQDALTALANRRFAIVRSIMTRAIEAEGIGPGGAAGGTDGLALAFCCLVDQHVNVLCRKPATVRLLTDELADWLVTLFASGARDCMPAVTRSTPTATNR